MNWIGAKQTDAAARQPFPWLATVAVGFIPVAVMWLGYPSWRQYFMADDFMWLQFVRGCGSLLDCALQPSPGRWTTPVSNTALAGLWKVCGLAPSCYYLSIQSLHVLNSFLVMALVGLLSRDARVGAVAGMTFAVQVTHYADWGVATWISAFVQLVVAAGYLVALIAFVYVLRRRSRMAMMVSMLAFAVSLLAKETAVSLPIVVLAWGWLLMDGDPLFRLRGAIRVSASYFVLLLVYLAYELRFQAQGEYLQEGLYRPGWHLLANWRYMANMLIPNPQSGPVASFLGGRLSPEQLSLAGWGFTAVGAALTVLLISAAIKGRPASRAIAALALIAYLPFLGFVEGFAGPNRYSYLASVGFTGWLATLWVPRLRARAAIREKGRMALGYAVLPLVAIAIAYIPTRKWQELMLWNSEVRRATIERVADVAGGDDPVHSVELVGYPDKFGDLRVALPLLVDVEAEFVRSAAEEMSASAHGKLQIHFDEVEPLDGAPARTTP